MEDNKSDDSGKSAGDTEPESGAGAEGSKKGGKKKPVPRMLIGVAGGLGVLILVLIIVLVSKLSSGKLGTAGSAGAPNIGLVDLSKINSAADIKSLTGGQLKLDAAAIVPAASLALYNPSQHRLEIGFFRNVPPKEVQDQLSNVQSFSDISAMMPDVLFILSTKANLTQCDPSAVERYQVFVNKNLQGMAEYVNFDSGDGTGIAALSCRLEQPAAVYAVLKRGNLQEQVAGQAQWDMQMTGPLVMVQSVSRVHYDSTTAKSVAAAWNRMDDIVEVGYFAGELNTQDKAAIRAAKSIIAQTNKKPSVVISLYLSKGTTKLDLNNVMKYGVTFFRDAEAGIDFAGDEEKQGFYYIVSPDKTSQITGLRGSLGENEYIQGRLTHEANKIIGQTPCKFSWELVFDAPLMDVFYQPTEEEVARTEEAMEEPEKKDESTPFARVSAGESRREFGSVIALYYSVENDLSVGFYADQLTAAEKEQIKKNKDLWRYVNNKRPNMVMLFDFMRGSQEASIANLNSYTVYLSRDKIGAFYFPGSFDQKSIIRPVDSLKRDEIKKLSGELKDGGTVALRIKGDHAPKDSPTKFTWDVNVTAEVYQVR